AELSSGRAPLLNPRSDEFGAKASRPVGFDEEISGERARGGGLDARCRGRNRLLRIALRLDHRGDPEEELHEGPEDEVREREHECFAKVGAGGDPEDGEVDRGAGEPEDEGGAAEVEVEVGDRVEGDDREGDAGEPAAPEAEGALGEAGEDEEGA